MPEMTPARAALGCGTLISILTGFGSGIYMGLNQARGTPVSPSTTKVLFAGPALVSGFLGFTVGSDYARDPNALNEIVAPPMYGVPEEMRDQARDQMKGCVQGCAPIGGAISNTVITLLGTLAGYYIGKQM